MMENKSKMTFVGAYEAPEVQVTEVLVEQGFQGSSLLGSDYSITGLNYSENDFNEFE